VSTLLEVLAPIVRAEQAYARAMDATSYSIGAFDDDDEPDFPELDGPVYLLGGRALVDATWTVVGDDPLGEVLGPAGQPSSTVARRALRNDDEREGQGP